MGFVRGHISTVSLYKTVVKPRPPKVTNTLTSVVQVEVVANDEDKHEQTDIQQSS